MNPIEKAKLSLTGLSVGDAFGEKFFSRPEFVRKAIRAREVPAGPWWFTDDTAMAIGIVDVLERKGEIDQNELADTFAENYMLNPNRGYGGMAHHILQEISAGISWKTLTHSAFGGSGSYGNGGAMRVAPLGAFFSDDFNKAAAQARLSAEVTHGHPEGQAGAIAVAVAAALAYESSRKGCASSNKETLFEVVLAHTPESKTREGIEAALKVPFTVSAVSAAETLGNGSHVSAQDTVPFCLWCAARHMDNYTEAMWQTVSGLGDRDTTCAIVGGIVSLSTGIQGIPEAWLSYREPLKIK